MTPQRYQIHFHDEAPRIGSGRRIVTARVGRKWVYLKTTAARARIRRSIWITLAPKEFV